MNIFHQAFNIISQVLLYLVSAFIILGLVFQGITCLLDKFSEKNGNE